MKFTQSLTRKLIAIIMVLALVGMVVFFEYRSQDELVKQLVIAFIASIGLIMAFLFDKD